MAFELELGESVAAGVRRIVDEQLETALGELRGADPRKADAAVHSARKRFKRVRAVVRLVRDGLGPDVFALENASFRDAGGALGEARDATVLIQTLDGLKGHVEAAAFAGARKRLLARRRAVRKRVLIGGDGLASVARTIEAARLRVADWRFVDGEGWEAIRPGLKRVYRDGRLAFERAEVGGHPELFHELRKRVKDLWHHMEVLEPIWPEMLKPLAEAFHGLADTLGEEHDFSVLKALLEAEALARAEAPTVVIGAIGEKRLELQREAKRAGERLFAEKTGAFLKRLGKYWAAWNGSEPASAGAVNEGAAAVQPCGAEMESVSSVQV